MVHCQTHKYHDCADNTWKCIENVATTASLAHFTVGDELWVDHIVCFGEVLLVKSGKILQEHRTEQRFQGCVLCPTSCFPKRLCDYICSISSQSVSIRGRRLLWYRVITLTQQSNCNVNAGMMVGRARVKAHTQIRLALIKQRRLRWWQPNLAHEGPRRLPAPFLRHSGSEWTHDSRSHSDHRRAWLWLCQN